MGHGQAQAAGQASPRAQEAAVEHRTSRQHVVDMCRTMLERGYLKATEGNVSVRVPGHRLYAVTPSNYDYDKMRTEDICLVDFDGKDVTDAPGSAWPRPSSPGCTPTSTACART